MDKKDKNTFLETIVNYALVIRADLDTIAEIKKQIKEYPNVETIYQKYSLKKLVINEETDEDDN